MAGVFQHQQQEQRSFQNPHRGNDKNSFEEDDATIEWPFTSKIISDPIVDWSKPPIYDEYTEDGFLILHDVHFKNIVCVANEAVGLVDGEIDDLFMVNDDIQDGNGQKQILQLSSTMSIDSTNTLDIHSQCHVGFEIGDGKFFDGVGPYTYIILCGGAGGSSVGEVVDDLEKEVSTFRDGEFDLTVDLGK
ncbi:hypothetical protein RHMOL_Rhmol01G0254600 [Rhododendron molle]|uniref:Uncharacterized protein n=1 Tax=Rhododendron molle TaxID=49168 RepID=A0ACC0Q4Y9_RHOML|nr:hypothetical protein RHMOL_Rhmol01G0254600 [Rhododendron molle]